MKIRSDSNAKFIYRRRAVANVFKTQNDLNVLFDASKYMLSVCSCIQPSKWHLLIHKLQW